MKTDVLIIGGGMAGLRLAQLLSAKGIAFHLIEARDRWGGRMLTEVINGGAFDLGPAWFWPRQPRLAALVKAHGIRVFDQYADGSLTYENEHGEVARERGFSSMQGSLRLDGGFGALTNAMAATLSPQSISLNSPARHLRLSDGWITVTVPFSEIEAKRVVLSLPPRLIDAHFTFEPPLAVEVAAAMQTVPTWMAGQAKALAVYNQPFWRKAGLSGDAMSRRGPMIEVHDASPAQGGPYGLFGFIGTPPQYRQDLSGLRAAVLEQFGRLFGLEAFNPISLVIKDWAFDTHTAAPSDHAPLFAHPDYGTPNALKHVWDGRLVFAATETAPKFGGYAEGAVEAAESAFKTIMAG